MSALAAHALGAATGDARLRRLTWPTIVFAVLAALGLALLAIFNTLVSPTAHLAFALTFFVCAMVWIGLDLAANRRWIGDAAAATAPYRRRWLAKRIIAVGAYIAFIIYIPIGLAIVERTSFIKTARTVGGRARREIELYRAAWVDGPGYDTGSGCAYK